MSFTEIYGNLFDMDLPAIGHGCNCVGVMGAGIAAHFRARWPQMYKEYHEFCEDGGALPGDVYPYQTDTGKMVFNLLTQPVPGPTARVEYIRAAVSKALAICTDMEIHALGVPRIGTGLGGLKWEDVRMALEGVAEDFPDCSLMVITLPPVAGKTGHSDVAELTAWPHPLYKVTSWEPSSRGNMAIRSMEEVSEPEDADIITSHIAASINSEPMHTLMLDIDVPAVLVPSSTPGHSHLYIDMPVRWEVYKKILKALAEGHVIEPGYAAASIKRGYTALRLPWVKKEKAPHAR